jgi:hypothetical protein
MKLKVHNYKEREAFSKDHDDFWEPIYRKAFPYFREMQTCNDRELQKMGIDRRLVFPLGNVLTFDEKLRETDEYPDILLEYLSNDQFGTPGWMEKNLKCDYIAYAWLSTGNCWFLSFPALKFVWDSLGEIWKKRYVPHKYAWNTDNRQGCVDYRTWSVAVPITELLRHLGDEDMFKVGLGDK